MSPGSNTGLWPGGGWKLSGAAQGIEVRHGNRVYTSIVGYEEDIGNRV